MDNGLAQVLESVFGRRDLEAVSVEEIRELIAEFPSFNAGHYFLSCKLKESDSVAYHTANRQTALYFNNPLWLQHLLEDPQPLSAIGESGTEGAPDFNDSMQPVPEEEVAAFDATGTDDPGIPEEPETPEQVTESESILNETFGGVNQEDTLTAEYIPQPDPMFDNNPAFEWPAESAPDLTVPETPLIDDSSLIGTSPQLSAELAAIASQLGSKQPVDPRFDEKKAKSIVFEPYHTIDYFASQGIKLVLDDNPADSFGRQLKSFTDWLKTMKRLPVQPLTGKANETETAEVKHFAADSVEDRDILTETMAEVLVKQGMTDNAIAIYGKLSLIYPLKFAYFAARIQQLKAPRA